MMAREFREVIQFKTRIAGMPPLRAISTPRCVRSISSVEWASLGGRIQNRDRTKPPALLALKYWDSLAAIACFDNLEGMQGHRLLALAAHWRGTVNVHLAASVFAGGSATGLSATDA